MLAVRPFFACENMRLLEQWKLQTLQQLIQPLRRHGKQLPFDCLDPSAGRGVDHGVTLRFQKLYGFGAARGITFHEQYGTCRPQHG